MSSLSGSSLSGGDETRPVAVPGLRVPARHRRQGGGPVPAAEIDMALMRRLAEGAAASGDLRAAAEAVRVCMAEAENLYQLAMAEREKALALARQAAEDQARARLLHDEAARTFEEARARRERPALGTPAQDAPGCDLRPDPRDVQTSAQLIEALRQFRTWAGNPSYRDMARACNGRPAASTMCRVLAGRALPVRFEVLDAIITACGGEEEDRERFATAWRRLVLPRQGTQAPPGQVRVLTRGRRPSRRPAGSPGGSPAGNPGGSQAGGSQA
jgi:hypothetical protein